MTMTTPTTTIFSMSDTAQERLVNQLIAEIEEHPHKDEVLSLAIEQMIDNDT